MKRQLSILASLFFLLILIVPSSSQGKTAVIGSSGLSSVTRAAGQDHANLYQTCTQLMDDADIDFDDDSDTDHSLDVDLHLTVLLHASTVALSDAAVLYLKSASNHLFTPSLFLSNRTLRL